MAERSRRRRALLVGAVVAVAVAVGALVGSALLGGGFESARTQLAGGSVWLASDRGAVSLLDGASELVLGSVPAPAAGALEIVQSGASALVVDPTADTVRRIDGATYAVSAPVRFGSGGGLRVLAGPGAAYVLEGASREAAVVDPASLLVRERAPLGVDPGPGQAVVDSAGRLWAVGGGGLVGVAGGTGAVRAAVGDAASRLVTVRGRAVLVDVTGRRAGVLGADGTVGAWSCLDVPADAVVLGSAVRDEVYAVGAGRLVVGALGGGGCGAPVPVGAPTDRFGPLVEAGNAVLVPDETTGRTVVVEPGAGRVVADLGVLPAGGRLELIAKDGLVFYNDVSGDRAGVIRFVDGQWVAGPGVAKFGSGLTDGNQAIAPESPPAGLPPPAVGLPPVDPRRASTVPTAPSRPVVTRPPVVTVPPPATRATVAPTSAAPSQRPSSAAPTTPRPTTPRPTTTRTTTSTPPGETSAGPGCC